MTLPLALGFVAVAAGGVLFRYRGRRAAALVLSAAAILGVAVSFTAGGREGVGELTLGALLGLPTLIGGAVARHRAGQAGRRRPVPAQR